ncbi:MAG: MarR family transcriptional regulator [Sneathiella sp.]
MAISKTLNRLALGNFLPYRLTKLSGIISRSLAERYSRQFEVSIHEWRVIAIIGETPGLTAREVGDLASLDKVNISRAIEKLEKRGRLERKVTAHDRRAFALQLTDAGEEILRAIGPLALEFETRLLDGFSKSEVATIRSFLDRLDTRADELVDIMKEGGE